VLNHGCEQTLVKVNIFLLEGLGTMDAATATALHQAGDVQSFQLIQAMSDTLPHDHITKGPGVHFQQWLRVLDPRTSEKQRKEHHERRFKQKDGIWSEADHASLMRYGEDGRLAARSLNEARMHLLNQHRYAGKSGRLSNGTAEVSSGLVT